MPSRVCAAVAATVLLAVLTGLSACSDDASEPTTDPTSSSSPSDGAGSESTSTGASDSASSSGSSVAPSTGRPIETAVTVRLRAPEADWSELGSGTRTAVTSGRVDGRTVRITVAEFPTRGTDIDEHAQADLDTLIEPWASAAKRQPNRVVNGQEGWVIAGKDAEASYYDFGAVHLEHFVNVRFTIPAVVTDPQPLIEAVLASIEWK